MNDFALLAHKWQKYYPYTHFWICPYGGDFKCKYCFTDHAAWLATATGHVWCTGIRDL